MLKKTGDLGQGWLVDYERDSDGSEKMIIANAAKNVLFELGDKQVKIIQAAFDYCRAVKMPSGA